jgi:hypothetical protein
MNYKYCKRTIVISFFLQHMFFLDEKKLVRFLSIGSFVNRVIPGSKSSLEPYIITVIPVSSLFLGIDCSNLVVLLVALSSRR